METHLILQKGEKLFLLLKHTEAFHLVSVDKRLTEEVEEKLLAVYPCSDATLRELGVNFQKLSPRGVAIGGSEAGDPVIFYIGKEKRKFVLSDDYEPEVIDAFFSGVERFQAPRNKTRKNPDAWRLAEQDPALVPVMKKVKTILMVVSVGSSILMLFHPAWALPGIISSIACGALDILYPAYFTLLDFEKKSKPKHAIGLAFAASFPLMAQTVYIMNVINYLVWWKIWLFSAALGVVVFCLFARFAKEFKDRKMDLFALLLMLVLFLQGPVGILNWVTDRSEPQTFAVRIEDKNIYDSSKGSDRYYCTIYLEDGTEFELQVSRSSYEQLSVGDHIKVASRSGGLGFAYISLVED